MKNINAKRTYAYFSLSAVLLYGIFLIISKYFNFFSNLLTKEICLGYYLYLFLLISGVGYAIDSNSRKDPAYNTLFILPVYALLFITICIICSGLDIAYIILTILIALAVEIGAYFFNRYVIPKLMTIKNGYQLFLFLYTSAFLTIIAIIAVSIL